MPRIIMKSPYMKPNGRSHIGNYVKYIATRDGVESADSTQKFMEQTVQGSVRSWSAISIQKKRYRLY